MISFSIVIPIYPPDFVYLQRLVKNINEFIVDNECVIKEVIFACSESRREDIEKNIQECIYPIIITDTLDRCNAAKNRNRGRDYASGDYVVFLDSDDIYHPMKIKITQQIIDKHPDTNLLIHSYTTKYSDEWYNSNLSLDKSIITLNEEIKKHTFPDNIWNEIYHVYNGNTNLNFPATSPIHHGISTIKNTINTRQNENFNIGEDGYFCRKVCWDHGGVVYVNLVLMIYCY